MLRPLILAGLLAASAAAPLASAAASAVRAGPRASGYSRVASAPPGAPATFGACVALAMDASDRPVIAYVDADADRDGRPNDGILYFIGRDPVSGAWAPPFQVSRIGSPELSSGRRQLSMAADSSGRVIAIVCQNTPYRVDLFASTDGGATWSDTPLEDATDRTVEMPRVALFGGRAHVAYSEDHRAWYTNGRIGTDAAQWPRVEVPLAPGARHASPEALALSVDASGEPAVAMWQQAEDRETLVASCWRPGFGSARIAATRPAPGPVDIAVGFPRLGGPLVGLAAPLADVTDSSSLYLATAPGDSGSAWPAPVAIHGDGEVTMGVHIALAVSDSGQVVVAERLGGDPSAEACGEPKLARRTRGGTWKTCSPELADDRNLHAAWPAAAWSRSGRLCLAFQNLNPEARVGAGVVVWEGR